MNDPNEPVALSVCSSPVVEGTNSPAICFPETVVEFNVTSVEAEGLLLQPV